MNEFMLKEDLITLSNKYFHYSATALHCQVYECFTDQKKTLLEFATISLSCYVTEINKRGKT